MSGKPPKLTHPPPTQPLPPGAIQNQGVRTCTNCGVNLASQLDLDIHGFVSHSDELPLRVLCVQARCNFIFTDNETMVAHLHKDHDPGIQLPQWDSQADRYRNRNSMRYPYVCLWPECFRNNRGFNHFDSLYYHFHSNHTRRFRMFECDQGNCKRRGDNGFYTAKSMHMHYVVAHKIFDRRDALLQTDPWVKPPSMQGFLNSERDPLGHTGQGPYPPQHSTYEGQVTPSHRHSSVQANQRPYSDYEQLNQAPSIYVAPKSQVGQGHYSTSQTPFVRPIPADSGPTSYMCGSGQRTGEPNHPDTQGPTPFGHQRSGGSLVYGQGPPESAANQLGYAAPDSQRSALPYHQTVKRPNPPQVAQPFIPMRPLPPITDLVQDLPSLPSSTDQGNSGSGRADAGTKSRRYDPCRD